MSSLIRFVHTLRTVGLSAILACADTTGPARVSGSITGTVQVRLTTTGSDIDPDGYVIQLQGSSAEVRVAPNSSYTFARVSAGSHALMLRDVASNCSPDPTVVFVSIQQRDEVVTIDLDVTCSALGTLEVAVATTGDDPDVTGYRVEIRPAGGSADGSDPLIQATGTNAIRLAAGNYSVRLREIAANCTSVAPAAPEIEMASGGTARVSFDVRCPAATWIAFATVSTATTKADIHVIRSNSTGMTQLTHHSAVDEEPAWSPDGTRIAFTSNRDGERAVHVMNENGTSVVRLTPANVPSYSPAWSPDGRRIAFVSERDGHVALYVMNTDGTAQARLTTHDAIDADPAWSPDGSMIAFSSSRDGNAAIYVVHLETKRVTRVTTNARPDYQPAWSPDGSMIAYSTLRCPDNRQVWACYPAVMVIRSNGSEPTEIGVGENPAWSPDGTRLAATGLTCGYYDYYYEIRPCGNSGVDILSPSPTGAAQARHAWERVLTRGLHVHPTWRPWSSRRCIDVGFRARLSL